MKSLSPSALEEGRSDLERNNHGPPGRYGEQVEYDIGTKDLGSRKVTTFNGVSRYEIEQRRAYKYRGKNIFFLTINHNPSFL